MSVCSLQTLNFIMYNEHSKNQPNKLLKTDFLSLWYTHAWQYLAANHIFCNTN